MNGRYDAIVIGASTGGLAAAALLSRAGAKVLLLERETAPPQWHGALYALDPVLVDALGLTRHGLGFCARDLPLVGFAQGAEPLTLMRSVHAAGRALAPVSEADARAWPRFRRDLFALSRRLRRWWWHANESGRPEDTLEDRKARDSFLRLAHTGADAFLAACFESETLRGSLLFDAIGGGFAPSEPGSALALVWRAAQEMAGLQGASALPACGSLVAALTRAARSADLRMAAPVEAIRVRDGRAIGVALKDGTEIDAQVLLSAVSVSAMERLLGGAAHDTAKTGEAQLLFTLSELSSLPRPFNLGRVVIADSAGGYADAYEAARAGLLPGDLPLECIVAGNRMIVTARPVPIVPLGGWAALKSLLAARIIRRLNCVVPGFAGAVTGIEFRLPKNGPRPGLARLLAPPAARLKNHLPNLWLCGSDAEPLPCVSGRAGRMAAALAARTLAGRVR